ncbi:hypothetical protein BY996DRAFT_6434422 [Phakopsora pachyrhizi]|nr:hypothetical protein BY996DRAFT_6434422 [Phakopsora pachyrhizi]
MKASGIILKNKKIEIKSLHHHLDKKAGQAGNANNDTYEVLSNSIKRYQFDSRDEEAYDTELLFNKEAHFSSKYPIPSLCNINYTREEVEENFEWEEKNSNKGLDSQTEKQHIVNKKRFKGECRKKEDNAQRRNIFEKALQLDQRIKNSKAEERSEREAPYPGQETHRLSSD